MCFVTEQIYGLDLVELQLRIAANEPLPLRQDALRPHGHAIEARINAEDPTQGFKPSPGRITRLELPEGEGLRVDTHLRGGDRIPAQYDSMICKLIAWGQDRDQALERLRAALRAARIEGVPTTIPLHLELLDHPDLRAGHYDTTTLETWLGARHGAPGA